MRVYIGVDCGNNGYLCVRNDRDTQVDFIKLPNIKEVRKGTEDYLGLAIDQLHKYNTVKHLRADVLIEEVSGSRGQSGAAMFTFGANYGYQLAFIENLEDAVFSQPCTYWFTNFVKPNVWKPLVGAANPLKDKSNKQVSVEKALEYMTDMGIEAPKKFTHDMADAFLMTVAVAKL